MTRPIPRLMALALLTACNGGELELEETDVFTTYLSAQLPQSWAVLTTFALFGDETSCPAVTQDSDTQWTLTGDCTADGSTWTGSAVVVEEADGSGGITYTGFGSDGGGMEMTLDGEQVIGADGSLTSDLVAVWDPGSEVLITSTYSDYVLADLGEYMSGLMGSEATTTLAGTMEMDNLTSFEVSGSWSQDATCAEEWTSGSLTLSGAPEGDIVFTWGDGDCDGCVPWTYGDQSGEACD